MSAEVLFAESSWREDVRPESRTVPVAAGWNPEDFGREQIRSLVRKVFFAKGACPVRQVVLSALDPQTDVKSICLRVGVALALESAASIAVVGDHPQILRDTETNLPEIDGSVPLRQAATRLRGNLWLVPGSAKDERRRATASLHLYLAEMRREFEYSILEGPPAGDSDETTAMAQSADGIILVLSAHRTRRVVARKVKEMLDAGQAHVLGTVLTDRVFPIPEGIYRRL
jgi:hypothetical protein